MKNPTLLAVDDDPVFLKVMVDVLKAAGYKVSTASNGQECLQRIEEELPDILITDLFMPGLQGTEICRRLKKRSETAGMPILILTASDTQGQEITCLDRGADDYMAKPFHWGTLLARCRALLRRPGRQAPPRRNIDLGQFQLDYATKTVKIGSKEHPELTPKEFELLHELAFSSPQPFSRSELYRRVWGIEPPSEVSLKTVEIHIRRIRLKLRWARGRWIGHIPGRGYFFKAPE